MSLIYGIEAIHQSASANLPHVLGFQTARTASDDTLFEVWNASTNAGIKAAVDLNGKYYSAAWTAGDIPYAVTGGVANVRRLDSLGIGTAYQVLQTNSGATAPEWTSSPTVTSLTLSGTLTLTGATVAGAPTWNSTQTLNTSGLAGTATALATARTINGVAFDGTSNITVTAAAGTLSGNTLAAGVTASSLTSVGTLRSLGVTGTVTLTGATIAGAPTWNSTQTLNTSGNAGTATALETARTINGVSFDGTDNITVTAAAGTLTGTTLASGVTASSLTSVGTLTSLGVSGTLTVDDILEYTGTHGVEIDGFAIKDGDIQGAFEVVGTTGTFNVAPDGTLGIDLQEFTASVTGSTCLNTGVLRPASGTYTSIASINANVGSGTGGATFTEAAAFKALVNASSITTAIGLDITGANSPDIGIRVDSSFAVAIDCDGIQVDDDSTSGNTRLLVYDVDNATLERVTVGAADSGGTNYKLLRIPN